MEFKNLFRKLDQNLDDIQHSDDPVQLVGAIVERLVDDFCEDLGMTGGRLYNRQADHYELIREYPGPDTHSGFKIPLSYPPVLELQRRGFVLLDEDDPSVDRELEAALGVRTFAGICVGDGCSQIVALSLKPHSDREHVIYTLNTIRHVINLKLGKKRLEDRVAEVREIQLSLLPGCEPSFPGFDIHGVSLPAEEVGGDLYDLIEVSDRTLGLAVVDSSGHGLPAALQARDAIIGLRMGVEERMRITATVEKLNRVIGRSALASKFISMFYGEFETNGTLVYCNAGHPPPLIHVDGRFTELSEGGRVLGPSPDARYRRGYARLEPGAVLLAYTDGITEAESAGEQAFGVDGIKRIVAGREWSTARELVEKVFEEVRAFSGRSTPVDDQTVVAILRRAETGA